MHELVVESEAVTFGKVLMVMLAVVVNCGHPFAAASVYVTVYVFGVLVEGVIAPVLAFIVKPLGEAVKVPPVVPLKFTDCGVALFAQKGPL